MVAQRTASARPTDPVDAIVAQQTAIQEVSANVKTVQAFAAMLEEVTRLKPSPDKP